MTGGTRKRGSSWSYYFDLGTINGKRKKKERGGFRTKKEAENALASALAEFNQTGESFEAKRITLSDYLDLYFEQYIKINLKYNTQNGKKIAIEKHIKPAIGNQRISALSPAILQSFVNDLKLNGYSKNYIEVITSTLSAALDYAVEPMRFIQSNPMRFVKIPTIEKKARERIILDQEQWNQIITRFPEGNRFYIPLMIGYFTGLRIGEVFGLTWKDVDFENKTISVNKQIVKRNSDWFFQSPKTKSSTRTIRIGDTLLNALQNEFKRQISNESEYDEYFTIQVLKFEKDEKNNDIKRILGVKKCIGSSLERVPIICIDENGELTTPESFKYAARVIHHDLGLDFDFHALRHTHATRLIESGVSPKSVQKRLGHQNILTTLQTYVHETDEMELEAVKAFEKIATE